MNRTLRYALCWAGRHRWQPNQTDPHGGRTCLACSRRDVRVADQHGDQWWENQSPGGASSFKNVIDTISTPARKWLRRGFITLAALGWPAAVGVYFVITRLGVSGCDGTGIEARIIAPNDGDRVEAHQLFRGCHAGLAAGENLWLLVRPVQVPAFFPQRSPVVMTSNGKWIGEANVGGEASSKGERFAIFVVRADEGASEEIRLFLRLADANAGQTGMAVMPKGVHPLDFITVTR